MRNKMWFSVMAIVIATATVLSACAPKAPAAPTSDQVEIFSWWMGGGEAAGLAAMQKVFEAQYPSIKFVNAAVAGGAGTNAARRAGDPPFGRRPAGFLAGPCRSGDHRHLRGCQADRPAG